VLAAAVLGSGPAAPPPTPAAAPDGASHSWYLGDLDPGRLRDLGAADAARARDSGHGRDVSVLDAGDPDATPGDTRLPDRRGPASAAGIRDAAVAYAQGWTGLRPAAPPLVLVVGVSNFGAHVTPEHGAAWGRLVDGVAAAAGPGVDVRGGLDAEPSYGRPASTRAWVRAYLAASARPFVDFGDCPCTPGQALPNGWTLADRAAVAAAGAVLPQQYRTSGVDAGRWATLDAYATRTRGRALDVLAALTEVRACAGPPARGCAGIDQRPVPALAGLSAALGRPVSLATDLGYLHPPAPRPAGGGSVLLPTLGALALLGATAAGVGLLRRRRRQGGLP